MRQELGSGFSLVRSLATHRVLTTENIITFNVCAPFPHSSKISHPVQKHRGKQPKYINLRFFFFLLLFFLRNKANRRLTTMLRSGDPKNRSQVFTYLWIPFIMRKRKNVPWSGILLWPFSNGLSAKLSNHCYTAISQHLYINKWILTAQRHLTCNKARKGSSAG